MGCIEEIVSAIGKLKRSMIEDFEQKMEKALEIFKSKLRAVPAGNINQELPSLELEYDESLKNSKNKLANLFKLYDASYHLYTQIYKNVNGELPSYIQEELEFDTKSLSTIQSVFENLKQVREIEILNKITNSSLYSFHESNQSIEQFKEIFDTKDVYGDTVTYSRVLKKHDQEFDYLYFLDNLLDPIIGRMGWALEIENSLPKYPDLEEICKHTDKYYQVDLMKYLNPAEIKNKIIDKLNESQVKNFFELFEVLVLSLHEKKLENGSYPESKKISDRLINLFSNAIHSEALGTAVRYRLRSKTLQSTKDYSSIPANIRGYIIYLFEGGEILPNRSASEDPTRLEKYEVEFTLSSLITAKRNQDSQISKFSGSSDGLKNIIDEANAGVDPSKAIRDLMHAAFNQKANSAMLWLREAFKNAKEAIMLSHKVGEEIPKIEVKVFKQPDKNEVERLVTEVHDPAGMDLNKIINLLLIPGETDKVGGGQGFFTIFKNTEEINIKTSTGNGMVCYVNLTPIPDETGKTIDFMVKESQVEENFKGTILQQVSDTNTSEVQASLIKAATTSYAGMVDRDIVEVKFGEQTINKPRKTLSQVEIPNLGTLKLVQANENTMTEGGLFIKDLNQEVLNLIPYTISQELLKIGIVLDIPKGIKLNNARDDIIAGQKDQLQQILSQYIPALSMKAYLEMYASGDIEINNIPYDYFRAKGGDRSRFVSQEILKDSQKLLNSESFDYTKYANSSDQLFKIMSVIPVFDSNGTKLSLNEIARMSINDPDSLPENLPESIQDKIADAKKFKVQVVMNLQEAKQEFGEDVKSTMIQEDFELNNLPNVIENDVYHAFDFAFMEILKMFNSLEVQRTYYYEIKTSLAHATISRNQIGFNLYYEKYWQTLQEIIEKKLDISHSKVQEWLEFMVVTITHERQHNLEDQNHLSHNQHFFDEQRKLIMQMIKDKRSDFQELLTKLHNFDPNLAPAKSLVRGQQPV